MDKTLTFQNVRTQDLRYKVRFTVSDGRDNTLYQERMFMPDELEAAKKFTRELKSVEGIKSPAPNVLREFYTSTMGYSSFAEDKWVKVAGELEAFHTVVCIIDVGV